MKGFQAVGDEDEVVSAHRRCGPLKHKMVGAPRRERQGEADGAKGVARGASTMKNGEERHGVGLGEEAPYGDA